MKLILLSSAIRAWPKASARKRNKKQKKINNRCKQIFPIQHQVTAIDEEGGVGAKSRNLNKSFYIRINNPWWTDTTKNLTSTITRINWCSWWWVSSRRTQEEREEEEACQNTREPYEKLKIQKWKTKTIARQGRITVEDRTSGISPSSS